MTTAHAAPMPGPLSDLGRWPDRSTSWLLVPGVVAQAVLGIGVLTGAHGAAFHLTRRA